MDLDKNDKYLWIEKESERLNDLIHSLDEDCKEYFQKHEKLKNTLISEINSNRPVPIKQKEKKIGNYYYYTKNESGKNYPVYVRSKELNKDEQILLDLNIYQNEHNFVKLNQYKLSPDHNYLAFSIDIKGNETYILYCKNLETGEVEKIAEKVYDIEWDSESKTIIFEQYIEDKKGANLYSYEIGTGKNFNEIYNLDNDKLTISSSDDRKILFMKITEGKKRRIYQYKNNELRVIIKDNEVLDYQVKFINSVYYILEKDLQNGYTAIYKSIENINDTNNWIPLITTEEKCIIDSDLYVFKDHLAVCERKDGQKQIMIYDLKKKNKKYLSFPDPSYDVNIDSSTNIEKNILILKYCSQTKPTTILEYDINNDSMKTRKLFEVNNYIPDEYNSERIFAKADDGTLIPVSLVYHKEHFKKDGTNPMLLISYGYWDHPFDAFFSPINLSLLNRGFIYAIAHLRGGGEYGIQWGQSGKKLKKQTTFNDLKSCLKYLQKEKYTTADKTVLRGHSAGGLTIGVLANESPELFKAGVAVSPSFDPINSIFREIESGKQFILNYMIDEFGDIEKEEHFNNVLSYSAYQNIKKQNYPDFYVATTYEDPRVRYWVPLKWFTKLKENSVNKNRMIFNLSKSGDHRGAGSLKERVNSAAEELVFVLNSVGYIE